MEYFLHFNNVRYRICFALFQFQLLAQNNSRIEILRYYVLALTS